MSSAGLSTALAGSSSVVCSSPRASPRFPHLSGIAHFVVDALPDGLRGLASSHAGSPAASRGCMGDGLAFSPPAGAGTSLGSSGFERSRLGGLAGGVLLGVELKLHRVILAVNTWRNKNSPGTKNPR